MPSKKARKEDPIPLLPYGSPEIAKRKHVRQAKAFAVSEERVSIGNHPVTTILCVICLFSYFKG